MSIEGKKKALIDSALQSAKSVLEATLAVRNEHPLIRYAQCESSKAMALSMHKAISATPHQHFNRHGKIDKRKVKRYNKKRTGVSYIVGENKGPSVDIEIINSMAGV